MFDFNPIRRHELTLLDLVERAQLRREDLVRLTNEMIDTQLRLIEGIADDDVTFVPTDPYAEDPYATNPEQGSLAWTLGHVIVHATASGEETCAHASILARGVTVHGRCRFEVPWEEMQTAADLHDRLEESRRIRLAYLNAWPRTPHYETTYTPYKAPHNCITRVMAGLFHDDEHLGQIAEIVRQAKEARKVTA